MYAHEHSRLDFFHSYLPSSYISYSTINKKGDLTPPFHDYHTGGNLLERSYPTHTRAFRNIRIQAPSSDHSSGAHEF